MIQISRRVNFCNNNIWNNALKNAAMHEYGDIIICIVARIIIRRWCWTLHLQNSLPIGQTVGRREETKQNDLILNVIQQDAVSRYTFKLAATS
jgi:hypothetical protein